jgi:hypothetical protein
MRTKRRQTWKCPSDDCELQTHTGHAGPWLVAGNSLVGFDWLVELFEPALARCIASELAGMLNRRSTSCVRNYLNQFRKLIVG